METPGTGAQEVARLLSFHPPSASSSRGGPRPAGVCSGVFAAYARERGPFLPPRRARHSNAIPQERDPARAAAESAAPARSTHPPAASRPWRRASTSLGTSRAGVEHRATLTAPESGTTNTPSSRMRLAVRSASGVNTATKKPPS
jgi:hypothetical protein